jgi:1,4-dihydroxy-2-naphthoate octaprenyltransferase
VNETTVRLTGGGRVPLKIWIAAARPRTLPAAVAPVLVGTSLAIADGVFRPLAFIAALAGSVFIQIGTNLANDYSDAQRGADTADRLGPVRVTASGLVAPRQVLIATWLAFGVAVLFGIYLIALVGWELLLIGVASILAGVLYTGGPRPYGYEGLGELFVFFFFGIVAVVGSYYVQTEDFDGLAFALAVPVGLLAAAILMVNNIRDRETDSKVGKRTLAVRLGRNNARLLYTATLWGAFGWTLGLAIGEELWLLPAALTIAALGPSLSSTVTTRTDGPTLNGALAGTARLLAIYSVVLSVGVLLGY